jgi:hypothetical protein
MRSNMCYVKCLLSSFAVLFLLYGVLRAATPYYAACQPYYLTIPCSECMVSVNKRDSDGNYYCYITQCTSTDIYVITCQQMPSEGKGCALYTDRYNNFTCQGCQYWMCGQGQLQLRRCSRKDFQHEVLVPSAGASFHGDAVLKRMLF